MDITGQDLDVMVARAEARERRARTWAAILTLVPILIAAAVLLYTSMRIYRARQEVTRAQHEVTQARSEVRVLQKQLEALDARIQQWSQYARHTVPLDWAGVKELYSRYGHRAKLLEFIIRMQQEGVRWKTGGMSPSEGFDSPSFAFFVMRQNRLSPSVPFPERYNLQELVPRTRSPQVGDLVFYEGGYALFYFGSFCAGMTPAGIVGLQLEFGPRLLGYGRLEYPQ